MPVQAFRSVLAVALLIGGVMVTWVRREQPTDGWTKVSQTSEGKPMVVGVATRSGRSGRRLSPDVAKTAAARPNQPIALSADVSALMAEQVALQLLAKDTALELTEDQWS